MNMTEESLADGIIRVALDGRLDLDGTREIENKFAFSTTSRAGRFAIDLSKVSFIASIGIRMLIYSARTQSQRGGKLVVVGPDAMGRKVLETAGVDQMIPIFDSLDDARAALAA